MAWRALPQSVDYLVSDRQAVGGRIKVQMGPSNEARTWFSLLADM